MKLEKTFEQHLCGFGENLHKVVTSVGERVCYVAVDNNRIVINFNSKVDFDQAKSAIELIERSRAKLI